MIDDRKSFCLIIYLISVIQCEIINSRQSSIGISNFSSIHCHPTKPPTSSPTKKRLSSGDPSSYSTPENVVIEHIDLKWNIDFDHHIVNGTATYSFKILRKCIKKIFLDVSNINIINIVIKAAWGDFPVNYFISDPVRDLGSKLTIQLPARTRRELKLSIVYETSPKAAALNWLKSEYTLGKTHPYMFSQCWPSNARSLVPCQDTPAVKFTYNAIVTHPKELTALLGAIRLNSGEGRTTYEQKIPIPSYLLAIAVGSIVSKQIGPNSKIWAWKQIIDAAAKEFSETPRMLKKAEKICGSYAWKQNDLLILPPSFAYSGMENPCLIFLSPSLIVGDKSLATTVAHEISHSWTGNLVTNANFEHYWLNEGFTTFVEHKIVGRIKGDLVRDFLGIISLHDLKDTITRQLSTKPALTKLIVDLTGVSPDDSYTFVPYGKGQIFLRYLEDLLGGPESFEAFLRFYLDKFKYQSIRSHDFKVSLYQYFRREYKNKLAEIDWDLWFYGEGMPGIIPNYNSTLANGALKHAKIWSEDTVFNIRKTHFHEKLTSLEKYVFLSILIEKDIVGLSTEWILLLEENYGLHKSKNSKVRLQFLRLCIKAKQLKRLDEILAFVNSNFVMKFIRPIYKDLGQWDEAREIAIANFNRVKDQMMAVCSKKVAQDLGVKQ